MMADSPVTFPKEGALPARFPPDVRAQDEPAEKDYYIFSSPCRSLVQIAEIQAAMPKGRFTPPAPDWPHLRRTRQLLTQGGELRLLALGDSIVNDTMRSGWVAKLAEAYPKAKVQTTVYVRGGGGCQHYKELDMTTPWAEYIRSAQVHPHRFYRDVVHANEYGEQILSKILMAFWTAAEPAPSVTPGSAGR